MSYRTGLFAYDISDDRVRRRVLRLLREWRLDGQLSVHECRLNDVEAARLFECLRADLDFASDHLLFAWVAAQRPILARGKGRAAVATMDLMLAA
jgi:CRISPR-associated protein Cas2